MIYRMDPKTVRQRREARLFRTRWGFYCTVSNQLEAVRMCEDRGLLDEALEAEFPTIEKTVRRAIDARLRKLDREVAQ